ncbi:MAG: glycosyltransferase family 4 protein [Pseudomonadota bacterium]
MLPLVAYLRQRGHVVSLANAGGALRERMQLLAAAMRHDLVLLQKKLFKRPFVTLLSKANSRIIFDLDDAVMFHELERGQPVDGKFFNRFAAIAGVASSVVAGNSYLADFARATRSAPTCEVTVLPTPIDTARLPAKTTYADRSEFVVGWIGTKGNLQQLQGLADPLREVQARIPDMCLRVVADAALELPGVRVEFKPWRAEDEVADLHGFDVGIMPLQDGLWNRGKGGYKLLQYMGAGLPAVASPVGINAEIIKHGDNGLLATSPSEWRDGLISMAGQAGLRQQLGSHARATVESTYSLDGYLHRYASLIEELLS